jgi:CheY-like chemotaxis protein
MGTPEWREEADGTFAAETGCFSLIVSRTADHRYVRFLIMARRATGADQLAGSGTRETIRDAMISAETVAQRLPNVARRIRTLVIVADDNDAVRDAIAGILRDSGYQVAEAASGEGALHRLERTTRPSILITDINLGAGMSGLQLAASVRELWPATGVLLVSGDDELLKDHSAGNWVLAKPFSIDRLLTRVAMISACLRPSAESSLN